jgi:hypothetical protein
VHFHNILTDGGLLYFSDFGLATSHRFDLSGPEREFLSRHRAYDRCCTVMGLACSLIAGLRGEVSSASFLREWIEGSASQDALACGLSPQAAAMLSRCAPPALLALDFHHALLTGRKTTPFPAAAIESSL